MLVQEAGPGRVFVRLREATGIVHGSDGKILSYNDWTPLYCVWCTSIWVVLVLMWLPMLVLLPLAASSIAILVHERLT